MAKNYRIKRNHSIYRGSPRRQVGRMALIAFVVVLLFGAGWFLYQPVYNFVVSGLSDPGGSSSAAAPQPQTSQPDPAISQAEPPAAPPVTEEAVAAAFVPESVMVNAAVLESYINALAATGVNTAVVNLKNTAGMVLYQSTLPDVVLAGAQSAEAMDLTVVADQFHAAGLRLLGKLSAFQDPLFPAAKPDAGVKYLGTEYSWLDNAPEQGGKMWLNPYSAEAQDYILAIMGETLSLGADGIILDGLTFPRGYALDKAAYGDTAGVSRADCLASFANRAAAVVEEQNKLGCWSWVSGSELLLADTASLGPYGGSIGVFAAKVEQLIVDVTPASFGISFQSPTLTIGAPMTQPAQTVASALSAIALPTSCDVLAVVQAYTSTGYAAEYVATVGVTEIEAQIAAAQENGADGYMLYAPTGDYTLLR